MVRGSADTVIPPQLSKELVTRLSTHGWKSKATLVTIGGAGAGDAQLASPARITKRIKALSCNGKKVRTVGIPIHWGFIGETQNGYLSNTLTPYVGDANSQTPEFKAFLVNLEKA